MLYSDLLGFNPCYNNEMPPDSWPEGNDDERRGTFLFFSFFFFLPGIFL